MSTLFQVMDSQAEALTEPGLDLDAASQFKAWACSPQQLDGSPELACGPLKLSPSTVDTTQVRSHFPLVAYHLRYLTCLLLEFWCYTVAVSVALGQRCQAR
jgi:hypothetical protein